MSELGRGDLVDRYIVLDLIGRGGMGVVLAAYDPDLDRKVALKLLHPGLFADAAEAQLRLQREAQAMARLSHPNVVSVHDVGTVGDAMFIAMEFVDGTLADWLAQRRSWRDIVALFLQAGRGLVAAHSAGIVHRDFKPANVLIDRRGEARVTDFGIASLGEPMGEQDLATGTPAYMAPEQHLKKPADARADQFAFCVALYEALYGCRPFRGDTVEEVAFRVTCQKPDPPPEDHEVPRWVWQALETGLHTKPEQRHASMRDLLLTLEHDPEAATRRGTIIRALIEFGRARIEEGHAGTAETVLRDALADALSAGDARLIAAAEVALAHVVGLACGRREEADERLASAERQLIEAGGDSLIEARLHHLRGALCAARQRFDAAIAEYGTAAELFEKALGPSTTKLSELATHTGVIVQRAGRPEEALVHYQRAHELAQRARGSHSVEGALALDGWGTALQTLGRYQEARDLFQQALDMRLRLLGPSHPLVGQSHSHLGQLLLVVNELEEAGPHLETALSIAEETHGPTSTVAASSLNNLGSLMVARGEWQQGLSYLERALAVAEHVFGPDRYETSIPLANLAWGLSKSGRPAEALPKFERALELQRAALGDDHPDLIDAGANVAGTLTDLQRYDEALAMHRRVLEWSERARGADHPGTAMVRYNLASTLVELRRVDEAVPLLEAACAVLEKALGADHFQLVTLLGRIGLAAQMREAYADGAEVYQRVVALYDRHDQGQHGELVALLRGLGDCLMKTGRHAEASEVLERAIDLARTHARPPAIVAVLVGMRAAALWEVGSDRAQAVTLAKHARDLAVLAGPSGAALLPYIDAWLREHPG